MKVNTLHPWNITTQEADRIQKKLAKKVQPKGSHKPPGTVAGADISFTRNSLVAYAGAVVMSYPDLQLIGKFTLKGKLSFPYIPGFLSFREAPILTRLFAKIKTRLDLIFLDGQGLAHPRRFGLACHMGLILDRPAIGCAKSRLTGFYDEPGINKGDKSFLVDENQETIGAVLRSKNACKPIFISIGHKIDLETALHRTLQCTSHYRIPEPVRQAHNLVNRYRKADESVFQPLPKNRTRRRPIR